MRGLGIPEKIADYLVAIENGSNAYQDPGSIRSVARTTDHRNATLYILLKEIQQSFSPNELSHQF